MPSRSSDVKLKIYGLWLFIGYFIVLLAVYGQVWFYVDEDAFTALATSHHQFDSTCFAGYSKQQGYFCFCSQCADLQLLHRAGVVLQWGVVLGALGLAGQFQNIQRKVWRLEGTVPVSWGVVDSDLVHMGTVCPVLLGLMVWLQAVLQSEDLSPHFSVKPGCVNTFIGSGLLTWATVYYRAIVKPAYLADLENPERL